jgi:hypothetical protein
VDINADWMATNCKLAEVAAKLKTLNTTTATNEQLAECVVALAMALDSVAWLLGECKDRDSADALVKATESLAEATKAIP